MTKEQIIIVVINALVSMKQIACFTVNKVIRTAYRNYDVDQTQTILRDNIISYIDDCVKFRYVIHSKLTYRFHVYFIRKIYPPMKHRLNGIYKFYLFQHLSYLLEITFLEYNLLTLLTYPLLIFQQLSL